MTTRTKMPAPERRKAIVDASRPLFARNGFRGTSVREIARAAEVSEALLYKHFKSKEELYEEVMDYAGKVAAIGIDRLKGLGSGTEALVVRIYCLVRVILLEVPGLEGEQQWHERLLYRSLLGDKKYARAHFGRIRRIVERGMAGCFESAAEAGDLEPIPIGTINKSYLNTGGKPTRFLWCQTFSSGRLVEEDNVYESGAGAAAEVQEGWLP